MRKLLIVMLFACLGIVQAMAQSFTYKDENGEWGCTVLSAEEKTVSIDRKFVPGPEVIIPSTVSDGTNEYVVTELYNSAWFFHYTNEEGYYRAYNLRRVTLPEHLQSIGEKLFSGCNQLLVAENTSHAKSVEYGAFSNCSSLQSVDLPACTSIGKEAFYCCSSLQSVDLPACTSIGKEAFYHCSSLQSVDLPACETIDAAAFCQCSNLSTVGDLTKCVSIGARAFQGCKIQSVNFACLETLGDNAFAGTDIHEVSLPATLQSMGSGCFGNYMVYVFDAVTPPSLSKDGAAFPTTSLIRVPESSLDAYRSADVWSNYKDKIISQSKRVDWDVQTQALETAAGLEKVIPTTDMANVASLKVSGTINGYDIFMIRTKMYNLHYLDLTDAEIVANDKEYYTGCHTEDSIVGANAFNNLDNLLTLALPKNAKAIGEYAVDGCDNLQKVTLPEKLESIGERAFGNCSRLTDIPFPPYLKNVGFYAFWQCTSLQKVVLPALESIEYGAFQYCSSLRELRVPSSLRVIADNAFDGCPLERVYTYTVEPVNIYQNTFDASVYQTAELWMPTQSYANYFYNTEWGQFRNENYHWFDEPYEYFYVNNDYTLDKDNSADKDKGRFDGTPDVDINPGGGLIVKGDENQGADEIHLKGDGTNWASIIANANVDAKKLYIDITLRANRWYFFCFPFDIKRSNISCGGSYVFRCYDGRIRAEQGHGGWVNVPSTEEYLQAGKGYIFQTSVEGTLSILVEREQFGKLPGVKVDCSLEANASTNEQDASWNFVGNPFTSFFNMEDMGYTAPVTRWNSETGTYEAVRPGDDDCVFHPFEAFFVQRPADSDNIEFAAEGRTTQTGAAKLAEASKAKRKQRKLNPERLLVNLTLTNGKVTDKTRVVYNPTRSNRYEMECDAAKFESAEAALQLYSIEAQAGRLAINERPAGSVRLGFTASRGGEYTLSATRMDQPVLLRDNVMNVTFDLSNGDYQFTTDAGTCDDRFMLLLDGSATGVADIARESGVNILPMEGGLNITGISGARVNVYSLSGALYATRSDDGFLALSRGAYVVEVGQMKAKVMIR